MLALGVHAKAVKDAAKSDKYLSLAEELTRTCREMYAQNPTGTDPAALHKPNWMPRIFTQVLMNPAHPWCIV